MGIAVVFRMYAEDGTFVSPAMGEVFELPEIESVHWRGDTPYTVRSVSDDALPAINLVFDVQRSRVLEDLLPEGWVAEVWRSAETGLWHAFVSDSPNTSRAPSISEVNGDLALALALTAAGLVDDGVNPFG